MIVTGELLQQAWGVRLQGGARATSCPGYMPGSAEDKAYKASEAERAARPTRYGGAGGAVPTTHGVRDSIRRAEREIWSAHYSAKLARLYDRCCHGKRS